MEPTTRTANQLVSVVVPSYLAERTLIRAIHSVVNDPALFEIIVAVNGEDASLELLRDFQEKFPKIKMVILLPQSQILSPGENWTRACAAATGKYIKLLCADDTVINQALFAQAKFLQVNPEVAFVTGKRIVTDIEGKVIRRRHGAYFLSRPLGYKASLYLCCLFGTNVFGEPSALTFRTNLLKQNLPWKNEYSYVIDLAMYFQILKNSPKMKVASLPLEVSTFEITRTSWSFDVIHKQLSAIRHLLFENLTQLKIGSSILKQLVRATTQFAFTMRNRQFTKLQN